MPLRSRSLGQSLLAPIRNAKRILPAPVTRFLKRLLASRRDRETIQALARLNAATDWETPVCVLCGGSNAVVHVLKNGYRIVRCRSDRLLFVSPRPRDVTPFYDSRYYRGGVPGVYESYDIHAARMAQEWSERLALLESMSNGRRLLDVGAATGNFLSLARERGWHTRGIDLSEWAASEAKRIHNLDVVAGSLPHQAFLDAAFDAITLWDCIEHLSDPLSVLVAARSLLSDNGVLALSTGEVPDGDPDASSGWYYPPWHLYYFSSATISALLKQAGFEILDLLRVDAGSPNAMMTVIARPTTATSH